MKRSIIFIFKYKHLFDNTLSKRNQREREKKNFSFWLYYRSSPPTPLSSGAASSPPLYHHPHRYYQDCNAIQTSGNLPITLHKYWEYRNSRCHDRDLESTTTTTLITSQHQIGSVSGSIVNNPYDDPSIVYVKQEWIPNNDDFSKDWN